MSAVIYALALVGALFLLVKAGQALRRRVYAVTVGYRVVGRPVGHECLSPVQALRVRGGV